MNDGNDLQQDIDVSVVIPCYNSRPFLPACVTTLKEQTLESSRFEVVFVFNGPDDGGAALAEDLLRTSRLQYQILESALGTGSARNLGSHRARGAWTTFLDVDDSLSPEYLYALLSVASSMKTIPVAGITDFDESGHELPSVIHEQIKGYRGVVEATDIRRIVTLATLKLIPTEIVRRHPFAEDLRSGEDVALFADMADLEDLNFDTTPAHEGATYRRLVRTGSVSRQGMTFDFMVTQRLDVIDLLDKQLARKGKLRDLIASLVTSQASFIARYLAAFPEEQDRLVSSIQERNFSSFPWYVLPLRSHRLIVSYNFAPFADPSSIVALKRAVISREKWNVISADMSNVREIDHSLGRLQRDAVAEHKMVDGPASWAKWSGVEQFCEQGWDALGNLETVHGPQTELHSRALWPASHFLGAMIKARRGSDVHWTAEFSDPLSTDVWGVPRPGVVLDSQLLEELRHSLEIAGVSPPTSNSLFVWAETLPYGLADRIMFTNPHQMSLMLSHVSDRSLRERILDRATIAPQPTLPRPWYEIGGGRFAPPSGFIHMGYFGSFYPTRGLSDVFSALAALPSEQAAQIKLHLFTTTTPALEQQLAKNPHRGSIIVYSPLPYLDFLRATRDLDVLVINDADTRKAKKRVNPYLPSKLSDYMGSGTPIWALVEPGSMLSRTPVAYSSRLGDVQAAIDVLLHLVP